MTLKALEGSLESRNCQSLLILLSVQLVRYFLRETVILICKEAFLSGSKHFLLAYGRTIIISLLSHHLSKQLKNKNKPT